MPAKVLPKQRMRICRYCGRAFSNELISKGRTTAQYQVYCSRDCYGAVRSKAHIGEPGLHVGLRFIRTEDYSLVEVRRDSEGLPTLVTLPESFKARWCISRMTKVYGRIVDREESSPPRVPIQASTHGNAGKRKTPKSPPDNDVIPVKAQIAFTNLSEDHPDLSEVHPDLLGVPSDPST